MADAPSQWFRNGTTIKNASSLRGRARDGWFSEGFTRHEYHSHRIRSVLQSTRTRFQECVLADTYSYGRCLVLDGEMQSTQKDEFIYHESLVHPAMLVCRSPRQVLILGGGEGATAREVLRHRGVEQVVMADLDEQVLDFCFRYLPTWHRGSFDHPKLRLLVEDARELIARSRKTFDVILSDLPSAIRGGPAYALYTLEFYRALRKRLNVGGVFALQAGSGQVLQIRFHAALYNTLRRVFRIVRPFYVYVPAYDVPWAFLLCSDAPQCDPLKRSAGEVDRLIRRRGLGALRAWDGKSFEGFFRPPKYLFQRLREERRVIRKNRPVYFFE